MQDEAREPPRVQGTAVFTQPTMEGGGKKTSRGYSPAARGSVVVFAPFCTAQR